MDIYTRTVHVTIDNVIWPMRFTCRITKATETHSEYLTRIAIPRPQWLREKFSFPVVNGRGSFVITSFNAANQSAEQSVLLKYDTVPVC